MRLGSWPGGLVLLLAAAGSARAATPLVELPVDKLSELAPLLRQTDMALIESNADGRMKQVTVMTLVAASPDVVREVVSTPEKWPEFVPSLTRARVTRHPDGSLDYDMAMDLKVVSLEANNHLVTLPGGAVDIHDNNPRDKTRMLVHFLPVKGGTVLVVYAYTDVLNANRFIQKVVSAAHMLEHGLALATQMAFVRSMKSRAEKLAKPGSFPPADPAARGPGFRFLLARGQVAVMRSAPDGHLAEISILSTMYAPESRIADVICKPGEYKGFVDGVKKSYEMNRVGDDVDYDLEYNLSVMTWNTRFAQHRSGSAIDVLGLTGDFHNARYRWDLTTKGPKETLVVYRASQDLRAASPLVLGTVFRAMPLFEHGLAVGLGLVNVLCVRGHAEGWK